MTAEHVPVLAQEIVEHVATIAKDAIVVDATLGYGGHSSILAGLLGEDGMLIGFDVDRECIKVAKEKLKDARCKVVIKNTNFADMADAISEMGLKGKVDFVLADLGWCSGQVVDVKRGMSFQTNMPLDMRLDSGLKTNAADLVNKLGEEDLADLIYKFGEDRASRRIARFIIEYRKKKKIATTSELANLVCKALGKWPGGKGIHPATRTFQALRIAVNSELDVLGKLLTDCPDVLAENGMVAIISFHSLEDRIVKENFKANKANGLYKLITKKPIVADYKQTRENPRARSAKLRIAQMA